MKTETKTDRIAEAYRQMAGIANYRPAAPGDGLGNVHLTARELHDASLLTAEAHKYAETFIGEEDTCEFFVGCANWATNRALVYAIEAARALCSGMTDDLACQLLLMALEEIQAAR
jgi:hypothetical protein